MSSAQRINIRPDSSSAPLLLAFAVSPGPWITTPRTTAPLSDGTCSQSAQFAAQRAVRSTRGRTIMSQAGAPRRAPWPFKRFLRTLVWYSPLGRAVGRGSGDLAVQRPTAPQRADVAAASARAKLTVFVSGASGGLGRRVVRELLRDESVAQVRALIRNLDRGVRVLRRAGVPDELLDEAAGEGGPQPDTRLQLIVSDLFNLRREMFDGVDAVISATGTIIGPSNDTPDRAMYYQGLTFYTPTLLEDTPENVEYVGIKALTKAAAEAFEGQIKDAQKAGVGVVTAPVWVFDSEESVRATWGPLDDVVMGGVSKTTVSVDKGELVFTGILSVQNSGGFTSARSVEFPSGVNLSKYDGVLLRVRGDGKRYKFILRCDGKWDGIAHCCSFDTVDGEYVDIKLPWSAFNTVFRGKTAVNASPLNPANISAVQIMLSKFEYDSGLNPKFSDGPFELRLCAINAYKESNVRKLANRFIHCSAGGVTRVLRRAEFKYEDLPPAVKLNDEVGRTVEWKLAGEDVVRQTLAKYGYTIVRPCAMTEKKPVGLGKLRLEQGDNITGQASRDDMAQLFVRALFDGNLTNKTFEVAQSDIPIVGKFETRAARLAPDSDAKSRTFGPFPFVPS